MAGEVALISAGASMAGDVMQQRGASATNATSMAMMYGQDAFNAKQAGINRKYQTQQLGEVQGFEAGQIKQQEDFQVNMADTQMQRRVQDLRRAGLNPALAYQLGGAASPMGGAAGTSVPGGATASGAGIPSLSNPNLGFGQLGGQVGSAEQLKSTINLQDAQANKLNVEAGTEIPAQVAALQSQTGLNDMKSQEAYKNIQLMEVQLEPLNSPDASMASVLQKLKVSIASMNATEQAATLQAVIAARNSEAFANKIQAQNIYKASDTVFGQIMAFFELGKPAVTSAATAAALAPK